MDNFLIVIEGTDGSGKQTQSELLGQRLKEKGYNIIKQSFPNYDSASSGAVKMYLSGELSNKADEINAYQASALFAVDRFCTLKTLQKKLKPKDIMIFDRYVESNLIHQACKIDDEKEQAKFIKWLYNFEYNELSLPRPNLVLFLDMPTKNSIMLAHNREKLKAGTQKDIHEQDEQYLQKSYQTGIKVAKKMGWQIISCCDKMGNIRKIEDINNEIYKIIENKMNEKTNINIIEKSL